MALVVQGNNPSDEIIQLLELENTKLVYTLNVYSDMDMHHMGMPQRHVSKLSLTYYINQHPNTPIQIFKRLEEHLTEFLQRVDGVFTQRVMEPFRGEYVVTVRYEIQLEDYNTFLDKVSILAKEKVDRDFTKALEAKLSED